MATKTPFTIDGTSQLDFNWKASSVEFTDGEDLQTKFDNKTIVANTDDAIKLYSVTGDATDGSITQKAVSEYIEAMRLRVKTLEDNLTTMSTSLKMASPPYQQETLVYNGQVQYVTLVYEQAAMTISGTLSGKAVSDDYQWIATLKEGYQWIDGTTSPKTGTWSIVAADNTSLKANKNNVALTTNYPSDTVNYTTNSDGELTVTSDDETVATVTVDSTNRTVTVTGQNTGTTNIQAKIKASTNYSASAIVKTPISVQFENSIGLLWDGPLAGGTGWTRVSGRSTASNITPISDANFNLDKTWPFNQFGLETYSGYQVLKMPIMYHRAVQIDTNKYLFFIESEQTNQNMPFNTFRESATKNHNYIMIRTGLNSVLTADKIVAKDQGTVFDIWDYELLLRLALIEYSPGKKADNKLTAGMSYHGIQSLIPVPSVRQFIPSFRSPKHVSGAGFKKELLNPFHKYSLWYVFMAPNGSGVRPNAGNWNLGSPTNAPNANMGQLFIDYDIASTTGDDYSKCVAYCWDSAVSSTVYYYTFNGSTSHLTTAQRIQDQSPFSMVISLGETTYAAGISTTLAWRGRVWDD